MNAAARLPPSAPEGLAIDDVVVWRRDAGTHDVITQGTVVSVIPAGVHPLECGLWPDLDLPLFARDRESYVVLLAEATSTLIRTEEVSQVRDELTLLLHKLGHKPPMIAAALNRHRTTTICALRDRLQPPSKKTRVRVEAWHARVDVATVAAKAAA